VLVGGPTGSGKSTTLAGIIDHINRTSARHVVTLEDPIEVMHQQKKCLINQRELGTHTLIFANALRATLRQDPDVILVGEMRDLDTVRFAVDGVRDRPSGAWARCTRYRSTPASIA
jgi:twitching motility protein PilT